MSGPDPDQSKRTSGLPREGRGVLASLPRTRPQRSSPRRAAAREAASSAAKQRSGAAAQRSGAAKQSSPKASKQRGANAPRRPVDPEPVPRQGYECPAESASGSIQPPGGAELIASAAELVGELAKAGVSTGERLLKDVLARLPLS
jgi:hypothetical protein